MVELRLNLNFNCSMADKKYQKALIELIREVLGEIVDDAVGLAEWKLRHSALFHLHLVVALRHHPLKTWQALN